MTIQQALESLHVSPALLSDADRTQLDEQGFLMIPDVLNSAQLAAICDRLDAILAEEGEDAGKEVHQEPGTDRMANLVNKGAEFDIFYTEPRVLAAISHVLGGDLKLSSLNARFAKPGEGLQSLHA